jgi:hypothetical protein
MKMLLALAALAAAAMPAAAAPRPDPDTQLQRLLAGRVPGRPVSCISLQPSTTSRVIDGRALIYRVGGTLYVNVPRSGADALDSDDILVTRTFGTQLCRVDTVNLIDRASRIPHGFVVLGDWVPYRRAPAG